jgi:conjugative transfer region protein (TIGR03748 family)
MRAAMNKLSKVTFILMMGICCFPLSVNAGEADSQVGRYLTVSHKTNSSQMHLLSQSIQVRFPKNVQTIGDAINYLLRFSGYSLVAIGQMNSALKTTISKPLPVIDRELGPISLKNGLVTLVGPAFYIKEDPINRLVDFRLKPAFAKRYIAQQKRHSPK